MCELYRVKNYLIPSTKWDTVKEIYNIETATIKLENDRGYHIRLDEKKNYVLFTDLEKGCNFKEWKKDMIKFIFDKFTIKLVDNDFLYTQNESNESSKHVSIPKLYGSIKAQKELRKQFMDLFKDKYITEEGEQYDPNVYKNSWFRMPNQSKQSKKNTCHRVIKGNIKDFLLTEIKDDSICIDDKIIVSEKVTKDKPINNITKKIIELEEQKIEEDEEKKYKSLLNILPSKYYNNYEDWIHVGMALKNININLKSIYDWFSKKSDKYNKNEVSLKWNSYKSDKEGYTLASLIKWAKEGDPIDFKNWVKEFGTEKIDYNNKNYTILKKRIEEDYFKTKDITGFFYKSKEGKLIYKTALDVKTDLMNVQIDILIDGEMEKIPFYAIWVKDPKIRTYNKLVFDPSMKHDSEDYNEFKGFKYDIDDEYVKENPHWKDNLKNIFKIFKHVLKNKNEYEFVLQWLAFIVQHPERKTDIYLLLYSDTKGIGKDTLIEVIVKLLDGYTAKIESIEDLAGNFNEKFCNKFFVYGDEIDQKAKKVNDLIKSMVTRKIVARKGKYDKERDVKCYNNLMFTSNNEISIHIEDGDRRCGAIHCNESKLTNKEYSEIYTDIDNDDTMKALHYYLKTLELPPKLELIETEYKKNLQHNNLPAYIQMIYKDHTSFEDETYSTKQLFKISKEKANEYHVTSVYTFRKMNCDFKKIYGKFYKKDPIRGYDFTGLLEHLKTSEYKDLLMIEDDD